MEIEESYFPPPDCHEGSEAYERFNATMSALLKIPKSLVLRSQRAYRKKVDANPETPRAEAQWRDSKVRRLKRLIFLVFGQFFVCKPIPFVCEPIPDDMRDRQSEPIRMADLSSIFA